MIFGNLELEAIVQVNDKTRLNAAKSFISKDEAAITLVEIDPDGSGYITVSGVGLTFKDWFIDWQYSTSGTKTVSLRITTNGAPVVFTKTISVLTAAQDLLWSSDQDLARHEQDILKWVTNGRNSFLDIHRKVQGLILDWLDSIRMHKEDGSRLEKEDILVTTDVNLISTYWALSVIFQNLSNKPDDTFAVKSKLYEKLKEAVKARGRIQVDLNDNGEIDSDEGQDLVSMRLIKR
jgi:hypothetical protein